MTSNIQQQQQAALSPRKLSPLKRLSVKILSHFNNMFENHHEESEGESPAGSVDLVYDSHSMDQKYPHIMDADVDDEPDHEYEKAVIRHHHSDAFNQLGECKVPRRLLRPQRPSDEGKITVVLDMDETLIHSEFTGKPRIDYRQLEDRATISGRRQPDFSVVLYENDPTQTPEVVHIFKRPGLDAFLEKLSEICEPVIFTASLPMYARPILKVVDPKRRCKSRLYRNATTRYMGYPHVKALSHIGRDLSRTILVDNSPFAMCADPDNAIPIKSYYDDPDDMELTYLYEIIREMVVLNLSDVRPHLKQKFNFSTVLSSIMTPSPVSPTSNPLNV